MEGGEVQWEILDKGEPSGPFGESQVLAWLREGKVTSESEVRPPGKRRWKTVAQVAEHHAPFAAALALEVPSMMHGEKPPSDPAASAEPTKRCPYCAELILAQAIRCKHCKTDLVTDRAPVAAAAIAPVQERRPGEAIGLLMALTPLASTVLIWFWVGQMNLFEKPGSSLTLIGVGTVIVTAILATLEASQVSAGGPADVYAPGKRRSGPLTWFIAMLLLWAICFPAWLFHRKNYGLRNYLLAGIVFGGAFIFSWLHMAIAIEQQKSSVLVSLGSSLRGPNKGSECKALIAVINKGIENLEKGQKKGGEAGPAELRTMAAAMAKVAEDAAKVKLTIPELKDFSDRYQAMAKRVATSARDMGAAAEAKNIERMTRAQETMEDAAKQEDPLVDGINKFCGDAL